MADKLNLVVPDGVVTDAKIKAIKEDVSLSAVVRAWLEQWVADEIPTPEKAKDEGKGLPAEVAFVG